MGKGQASDVKEHLLNHRIAQQKEIINKQSAIIAAYRTIMFKVYDTLPNEECLTCGGHLKADIKEFLLIAHKAE